MINQDNESIFNVFAYGDDERITSMSVRDTEFRDLTRN